jgi:hypothetical protein
VLVVGCSSQPWLVPKKDESAFLGFWTKMLHLPLPDYAARRVSKVGAQLAWKYGCCGHCHYKTPHSPEGSCGRGCYNCVAVGAYAALQQWPCRFDQG